MKGFDPLKMLTTVVALCVFTISRYEFSIMRYIKRRKNSSREK